MPSLYDNTFFIDFITFLFIIQPKTDEEHQKQVSNILKKENKKRKKMKDLGIDYDFPGYVSYPYFCFIQ